MALIEFETGLSGSGNRNQQQQRLNLHDDDVDDDDVDDDANPSVEDLIFRTVHVAEESPCEALMLLVKKV